MQKNLSKDSLFVEILVIFLFFMVDWSNLQQFSASTNMIKNRLLLLTKWR